MISSEPHRQGKYPWSNERLILMIFYQCFCSAGHLYRSWSTNLSVIQHIICYRVLIRNEPIDFKYFILLTDFSAPVLTVCIWNIFSVMCNVLDLTVLQPSSIIQRRGVSSRLYSLNSNANVNLLVSFSYKTRRKMC